jgi:hypothetical protein
MDVQLGLMVVGIVLVVINYSTLAEVCQYYFGKKSYLPEITILTNENNRILGVLGLIVGIALIATTIIPPTLAVNTVEDPTEFFKAVNRYSFAGFVEEAVFRIIPFLVMFVIRTKLNFGQRVEKVNVVVAIIITASFAFIHITNYINPDIWAYVLLIPLFLMSLPLWFLIEKNGLFASTIVHVLYNIIWWTINYLLF